MSVISELDQKVLKDYLKQALEKQVMAYIEGNVKKNIIQTHQRYMKVSAEKSEAKNQKELKKIFKESIEKVRNKNKPSIALEIFKANLYEDGEAPTNAMGASSSTQGPIQTFDPLLTKRKIKRKVPAKETIK